MTGSGTAIGQSDRDFVEPLLSRVEMVDWDRFVVGEDHHGDRYIKVYGWIDRPEDEYKDFVLLHCLPDFGERGIIGFTTSSDRYTQEIHRKLFDAEPDDHNDCRRVEHAFDVENAIELESNSSLEEFA